MGHFFRVGRSCSVPDFNGFPRVVQCAGQVFCVEIFGFAKKTEISVMCGDAGDVRCVAVWMVSFVLLDGAVFVGVVALVVAGCVCGGSGDA